VPPFLRSEAAAFRVVVYAVAVVLVIVAVTLLVRAL
jgi:hypothetical protein